MSDVIPAAQPVVRGAGSPGGGQPVHNGVAVLPRSSSVARSNSLRQHSPPLRVRAAQRGRPAQGPLAEEAEREEPPGPPRPPPPGHGPPPDAQVRDERSADRGDSCTVHAAVHVVIYKHRNDNGPLR